MGMNLPVPLIVGKRNVRLGISRRWTAAVFLHTSGTSPSTVVCGRTRRQRRQAGGRLRSLQPSVFQRQPSACQSQRSTSGNHCIYLCQQHVTRV